MNKGLEFNAWCKQSDTYSYEKRHGGKGYITNIPIQVINADISTIRPNGKGFIYRVVKAHI
jgi:hypothetical protein